VIAVIAFVLTFLTLALLLLFRRFEAVIVVSIYPVDLTMTSVNFSNGYLRFSWYYSLRLCP